MALREGDQCTVESGTLHAPTKDAKAPHVTPIVTRTGVGWRCRKRLTGETAQLLSPEMPDVALTIAFLIRGLWVRVPRGLPNLTRENAAATIDEGGIDGSI